MRRGDAHRLDDVVGEQGPLVEVDRRLGHRPGDVGVGREVDHHLVAAHRVGERGEVSDILAHHTEPWVVAMRVEMRFSTRAEVVEDGHLHQILRPEQAIDKRGADESRTSCDEVSDRGRFGQTGTEAIDSHFVDSDCRAG